MEQKQKKRFPFFTIPAPKFLMADLKKIDDFVVMVRITPKITLLYYIERITYLTAFLVYSSLIIIQMLYIILNVPLPKLLAFVLRNGKVIAASLWGVPIPPAQQQGVAYFWLFILLIASTIWISIADQGCLSRFSWFTFSPSNDTAATLRIRTPEVFTSLPSGLVVCFDHL